MDDCINKQYFAWGVAKSSLFIFIRGSIEAGSSSSLYMIGLGPLRRRRTNAPDVGNQLESVGVVLNPKDSNIYEVNEEVTLDQLEIMSCRDRTSEFLSTIKSLQSRQVRRKLHFIVVFFGSHKVLCWPITYIAIKQRHYVQFFSRIDLTYLLGCFY